MADEEDEFPVWWLSSDGGLEGSTLGQDAAARRRAEDASFDALREVHEALKKIDEKPQRVVAKTMWDVASSPSLMWAAEGHAFELETLQPGLPPVMPIELPAVPPHPLIPRGVFPRLAPALWGTVETDKMEASALGGEDGLPPRLEIRASFDEDSFVVAVVFGGGVIDSDSTERRRGEEEDGERRRPFHVYVTSERQPDVLVAPAVGAEEVAFGTHPMGYRDDRVKACAAAAVLVTWREAVAAGLVPALPSFVGYVSDVVRETLSGDTVMVGRNVWPTCVDAGVATCAVGVAAGEAVKGFFGTPSHTRASSSSSDTLRAAGGVRAGTLMLRQKLAKMYEDYALRPLPGSSGQDRVRCYNAAVKAYKDLFHPSCLARMKLSPEFFRAQAEKNRSDLSALMRHSHLAGNATAFDPSAFEPVVADAADDAAERRRVVDSLQRQVGDMSRRCYACGDDAVGLVCTI